MFNGSLNMQLKDVHKTCISEKDTNVIARDSLNRLLKQIIVAPTHGFEMQFRKDSLNL